MPERSNTQPVSDRASNIVFQAREVTKIYLMGEVEIHALRWI